MSVTRDCVQLLEAGSRYHVHYGDRLANHLPMVLIALDKLGAGPVPLKHAFDRSTPHLHPRPGSPVDEIENPASCRNRDDRFPSALHYYEQQLRQFGIARCLQQELPALLPAIATAAFHGLIRTAYGIDARHLEEVAMGLAYWNLDYQELHSSAETIPTTTSEIILRLAKQYPEISLAPGNIADHMHSVTGQPGWMETPIQPSQIALENVAAVAVDAYLGTRDFTLLHGVTGCHALRLILPYCNDKEAALRYFWQGLVVAYLSTGPKTIKPAAKEEIKDISQRQSEIREKALGSDDDHVIKLAYSALEEFHYYGHSEYLQVFAQ
ncbi:questin oxidase family protein [Microbulbifer pacificus]|uniref:Questin oxidase family protein n=1 Tax=Microbulbifer pacificus TaxID=407164 RepID=A0AAU0MWV2_9GAMM|nr:questin oxidase family protein [Microbulbifer pacificus]WOX04516.1 questin oxidase family protein [Microbulbifer pacificus]